MEALHLGSSSFRSFNYITNSTHTLNRFRPLTFRRSKIRAVGTVPQSQSDTSEPQEPPMVDFAFVNVSCNVQFLGFILRLSRLIYVFVEVCIASWWNSWCALSSSMWWAKTQKHNAWFQCWIVWALCEFPSSLTSWIGVFLVLIIIGLWCCSTVEISVELCGWRDLWDLYGGGDFTALDHVFNEDLINTLFISRFWVSVCLIIMVKEFIKIWCVGYWTRWRRNSMLIFWLQFLLSFQIVEGKELLNPRTDIEKDKLKKVGIQIPLPLSWEIKMRQWIWTLSLIQTEYLWLLL